MLSRFGQDLTRLRVASVAHMKNAAPFLYIKNSILIINYNSGESVADVNMEIPVLVHLLK